MGFGVYGFGFRVSGFGFRVEVKGVRFRVYLEVDVKRRLAPCVGGWVTGGRGNNGLKVSPGFMQK